MLVSSGCIGDAGYQWLCAVVSHMRELPLLAFFDTSEDSAVHAALQTYLHWQIGLVSRLCHTKGSTGPTATLKLATSSVHHVLLREQLARLASANTKKADFLGDEAYHRALLRVVFTVVLECSQVTGEALCMDEHLGELDGYRAWQGAELFQQLLCLRERCAYPVQLPEAPLAVVQAVKDYQVHLLQRSSLAASSSLFQAITLCKPPQRMGKAMEVYKKQVAKGPWGPLSLGSVGHMAQYLTTLRTAALTMAERCVQGILLLHEACDGKPSGLPAALLAPGALLKAVLFCVNQLLDESLDILFRHTVEDFVACCCYGCVRCHHGSLPFHHVITAMAESSASRQGQGAMDRVTLLAWKDACKEYYNGSFLATAQQMLLSLPASLAAAANKQLPANASSATGTQSTSTRSKAPSTMSQCAADLEDMPRLSTGLVWADCQNLAKQPAVKEPAVKDGAGKDSAVKRKGLRLLRHDSNVQHQPRVPQ